MAEVSFFDKFKLDVKTLWNDHRTFFIIFGIMIIIVKFRDVLIDLLISGAKKEMDGAKKQDAVLAGEENKAKAQADELVLKAQQEPSKQEPVTTDWNKK